MLSDKSILEQLHGGNILIEPFDDRHLGTNSYDCRLGEWYYSPSKQSDVIVVHLDNQEELTTCWGEALQARDGYITIYPGTTILAHTYEYIGARNGYCANMHSRSTIARSGLSVCRCAGVGDVGYIGRWTMEISNHTRATICVPVGMRICQFTFEHVGETLKEYQGKYGSYVLNWNPRDMLPKTHQDYDYRNYPSCVKKVSGCG